VSEAIRARGVAVDLGSRWVNVATGATIILTLGALLFLGLALRRR
jgi:uncharacterized protein (TIGR03382 family)